MISKLITKLQQTEEKEQEEYSVPASYLERGQHKDRPTSNKK